VVEPGWRFTLDEYVNALIEHVARGETPIAEAAGVAAEV
jgi:hypothetical protein